MFDYFRKFSNSYDPYMYICDQLKDADLGCCRSGNCRDADAVDEHPFNDDTLFNQDSQNLTIHQVLVKVGNEVLVQKEFTNDAEFQNLARKCINKKSFSTIMASCVVARVNGLNLLRDLFFPVTLNLQMSLMAKIKVIAFSIFIDLATMPIRILTLLPRILYLKAQQDHPLLASLRNLSKYPNPNLIEVHFCTKRLLKMPNSFTTMLSSIHFGYRIYLVNAPGYDGFYSKVSHDRIFLENFRYEEDIRRDDEAIRKKHAFRQAETLRQTKMREDAIKFLGLKPNFTDRDLERSFRALYQKHKDDEVVLLQLSQYKEILRPHRSVFDEEFYKQPGHGS